MQKSYVNKGVKGDPKGKSTYTANEKKGPMNLGFKKAWHELPGRGTVPNNNGVKVGSQYFGSGTPSNAREDRLDLAMAKVMKAYPGVSGYSNSPETVVTNNQAARDKSKAISLKSKRQMPPWQG